MLVIIRVGGDGRGRGLGEHAPDQNKTRFKVSRGLDGRVVLCGTSSRTRSPIDIDTGFAVLFNFLTGLGLLRLLPISVLAVLH